MFTSASHGSFGSLESEGLNTNSTSSVTDSMYINGNQTLGVYVYADTGTHAAHIVTIQISMNDIDWIDTPYSVTGAGYKEGTTVAQYMRAKVTTAEGSNSTCNVHIASK